MLADLQLDVHLAKVATYTGRVVDAFYVRDALGGKITSPEQIAEDRNAPCGPAARAKLVGMSDPTRNRGPVPSIPRREAVAAPSPAARS